MGPYYDRATMATRLEAKQITEVLVVRDNDSLLAMVSSVRNLKLPPRSG